METGNKDITCFHLLRFPLAFLSRDLYKGLQELIEPISQIHSPYTPKYSHHLPNVNPPFLLIHKFKQLKAQEPKEN